MTTATIRIEMTIGGQTAAGVVEVDEHLIDTYPGVMADEMARCGKTLCDRLADLHQKNAS